MVLSPEVTKLGNVTVYFGSGAPSTGAYFNLGDIYFRTDPSPSNPWLYVCTTGGSSTVWKSAGNLAA